MVKSAHFFSLALLLGFIFSCKDSDKVKTPDFPEEDRPESSVKYANGFSIDPGSNYSVLIVTNPWPGSKKKFKYALVPREKLPMITLPKDAYNAIIATPVENLVVTSTTHIPALERLGALDKLVGFPDTQYISSAEARKHIDSGKIKELGSNESINTEMVLEMRPDVVVGFSIDNQNPTYQTIQKAQIPVIYNGDWTEQNPLGKAEWIKFFGVLLNKQNEANSIFDGIEKAYLETKELAAKAEEKPTVLSGALYKDVWYLPAGESWAATFIKDAHADYLWKDSEGNGSLSLSVESVLEKAKEADFWVSPSQFTSYAEMMAASPHYNEFKAFQEEKVFTFAANKGPTGGLLYYELAPQRPDLVIKDLVHIFHPKLLPDYEPQFFTPLEK